MCVVSHLQVFLFDGNSSAKIMINVLFGVVHKDIVQYLNYTAVWFVVCFHKFAKRGATCIFFL